MGGHGWCANDRGVRFLGLGQMFAPNPEQFGVTATKFFEGGRNLRAVFAKGFAEFARGRFPLGCRAAVGLALRWWEQNHQGK